jgi:sulfatase modifying factor 1
MMMADRQALLVLLQNTPEALQPDMAAKLGFDYHPTSPSIQLDLTGKARGVLPTTDPEPESRQDRSQAHFWYKSEHKALTPAIKDTPMVPTTSKQTQTTTHEQFTPKPLFSPAQQQSLFDLAMTKHHRPRGIDITKVVTQIARQQPIRCLPKKQQPHPCHDVIIIIDNSERLYPATDDLFELAFALQKQLSIDSCSVYFMYAGSFDSIRQPYTSGKPELDWWNLPPQALLVFFSDCGEFSERAWVRAQWQTQLKHLKRLGHRITVLTPNNHINDLASAADTTVSLDNRPSQLALLQACAVSSVQPQFARIRHIRQHITHGALADELKYWNHPQVEKHQVTSRIKDDARTEWSQAQPLTPAQYQQLINLLDDDWQTNMSPASAQLEQMMSEVFIPDYQAPNPMQTAAITNASPTSSTLSWFKGNSTMIMQQARALIVKPQFHGLLDMAQQLSDNPKLNSIQLNQQLNQHATTANHDHHWQPNNQTITLHQHAHHFIASTRLPVINVITQQSLSVNQSIDQDELQLRNQSEQTTLKRIRKPRWAERIWQDASGIYAAHGNDAVFHQPHAALTQTPAQGQATNWQPLNNPFSWADDIGVDDYGLWAKLNLNGVSFRLRWIPSGSFMMGSPKAELERRDNETQHTVTLTEGYWLADTVCTQSLWQAVMDNNPSDFKGDELPVEQVSYKDCQIFIKKASALLDGRLFLNLPTEAQWEYACRAGTTPAFSFGNSLSPDQANYDGNYPYPKDGKGEYRETTVEVTAFKPNSWGLFNMHGNVWEWCNDFYRNYSINEATNPIGPAGGNTSVLRGGGWSNDGRFLRSAYRLLIHPASRRRFLGFRLSSGLASEPAGSVKQAQASTADRWARSEHRVGGARQMRDIFSTNR